jgi:hypothetical protein
MDLAGFLFLYLILSLSILFKAFSELNNIGKILIFFLITFTFLNFFQKVKAKNIYKDKYQSEVQFLYMADTIQTNNCLRFLGSTSGYIFLRNLNDSTNYFYDKKDIKYLSVKNYD